MAICTVLLSIPALGKLSPFLTRKLPFSGFMMLAAPVSQYRLNNTSIAILCVSGILDIAVSSGARHLSHTYGFVITFAVSTNLTQYVLSKCRNRRQKQNASFPFHVFYSGNHWNRYGPFYFVALSVPLTSMDYIRHTILGTLQKRAKLKALF